MFFWRKSSFKRKNLNEYERISLKRISFKISQSIGARSTNESGKNTQVVLILINTRHVRRVSDDFIKTRDAGSDPITSVTSRCSSGRDEALRNPCRCLNTRAFEYSNGTALMQPARLEFVIYVCSRGARTPVTVSLSRFRAKLIGFSRGGEDCFFRGRNMCCWPGWDFSSLRKIERTILILRIAKQNC